LHFKGGKAVACFIGAFLYLGTACLSSELLVFIAVVAVSKYISLGSIIAALVFPVAVWRIDHTVQPILGASIFAAVLIIYRHKQEHPAPGERTRKRFFIERWFAQR
jgi:glycerol-3-phosphate acyltransferase PlsY